MAYILTIDQGTTSSRAIIFNEQGQICAIGQHDFPQYYPQNGWVEHDAEQIWQTSLQSCQDALQKAKLHARDICGLGITNQRETTVVWNKTTGQPIYRAIVWQDRRTAAQCTALKQTGCEALVAAKTGLLLDPYFSATKIAWILDNVPDARHLAEAGQLLFGTIETFLLWRLTQGQYHYSDVTNASRTLLLNIHTQQWDDELLNLFRIPRQMLPKIVDNYGDFGCVDASWLGAPIPISAMIGDQQGAAFGEACFEAGMVKSTYGTGCFMLLHTGDKPVVSQHQLLTTIQYRLPQQLAYGLEGSIFIAGAAVQWLRDGLGLIHQSSDIQTLAAQVPDNGGVYFIPAFTGLGAPYWNPHARGMITGITRDTKAAHFARATQEAIAYQTCDLLTAMQQDNGQLRCLRVDGGMVVNDDLLQLLADILRLEIHRPRIVETTALGAAFLVGLAQNIYPSLAAIASLWQLEKVFKPAMAEAQRKRLYDAWCYWIKVLNRAYDHNLYK